ncbi:MAG: GNAT family N-acetyltransferase [Ruminococcaceae bacterium]|nr:GNAT family N-acetyltransferase [Oscillospiraceae bacterium]
MRHTVDFANVGDYENITSIWRMAFADSDEYIKDFFNMMYKDGYALVSRVEGVPVAVAFFLEAQFVIKGRPFSAYYFYAASTHPSHRRQGHMGAILNKAEEVAIQRNVDFIILVPAEGPLYRFYAKFGYQTTFAKRVVTFTREELQAMAVEPDLKHAFSMNIFDIRQTSLGLYDFLNWGEDALKYAMYEHNAAGGSVAFTSDGYAMYETGKKMMIVKEICSLSHPGELFTMLLMEDDVDIFKFWLPVKDPIHSESEEIIPVGMCLGLNEVAKVASFGIRDAYIGITLG